MREYCARYPTLRRGGMSFDQVKRMLKSRAQRKGLKLNVELMPWPHGGSLAYRDGVITITIDNRRSPSDQLFALAHEAGHLIFGHYEFDEEIWTLVEGPDGNDEWEEEANLFAQFATRTPGTPPEWFLNEQLRLRLSLVSRRGFYATGT